MAAKNLPRGRLMRDDDAHWYFIPVELCARFTELLDLEDHDAVNDEYEQFRLEMHPSNYVFDLIGETPDAH